jgi:hypothetical protein
VRTEKKVRNRRLFMTGGAFGLSLVLVKLFVLLPIDIADPLYGLALLVTLVIAAGELLEIDALVWEAEGLDFVFGLLFPLDCYAAMILVGVPLPD